MKPKCCIKDGPNCYISRQHTDFTPVCILVRGFLSLETKLRGQTFTMRHDTFCTWLDVIVQSFCKCIGVISSYLFDYRLYTEM